MRITSVNLPRVTEVGDWFLCWNKGLTTLDLPKLTEVGDSFIPDIRVLAYLSLPELTKVGSSFLLRNEALTSPRPTQANLCR